MLSNNNRLLSTLAAQAAAAAAAVSAGAHYFPFPALSSSGYVRHISFESPIKKKKQIKNTLDPSKRNSKSDTRDFF